MDSDSDDELMNVGINSPNRNVSNSQLSYNSDSSIESDTEGIHREDSIGNSQLQQLLDEANARKAQNELLAKASDIKNNVKKRKIGDSDGSIGTSFNSVNLTINLGGTNNSEEDSRKKSRQEQSLKDTVNAIDKEKNIDSKNLSKDLGTNGYPNHVVKSFYDYDSDQLAKKANDLKQKLQNDKDLQKLNWETLWSNSFMSKLEDMESKNSLGQLHSDQCKLLFNSTVYHTYDTEKENNVDLIYQRGLFLQSLVNGKSITHAPPKRNIRTSRQKNNYFGWNITFDDFVDVFKYYGINMKAIQKASVNLAQNNTLDALSLQRHWDYAMRNYFREETPEDDVHAFDDDDSDGDGENGTDDDDLDEEHYIRNNITPRKKKKEINPFDREHMPSISSLKFVVKFLRIVDIDTNVEDNNNNNNNNNINSENGNDDLNSCEQIIVALVLLLSDAVIFDIAIAIQETILSLWKKYISVEKPRGRKRYIKCKLREIFVHRQLYNLGPLLYSLPNNDIFDDIKIDISRRVLNLRCFPNMSESELKVKVFTQDELSTTLTMNEIAEYLEELPKLTAIGGASGNSKSSSSSSDSTKEHSNATSIHHADTLDLIILIGEIIVAMGDKEAKSKFVTSLEALLLKANKKKLSKNMPFKMNQDIRMNCQITLSKYLKH